MSTQEGASEKNKREKGPIGRFFWAITKKIVDSKVRPFEEKW